LISSITDVVEIVFVLVIGNVFVDFIFSALIAENKKKKMLLKVMNSLLISKLTHVNFYQKNLNNYLIWFYILLVYLNNDIIIIIILFFNLMSNTLKKFNSFYIYIQYIYK